jgi:hypothetical protein
MTGRKARLISPAAGSGQRVWMAYEGNIAKRDAKPTQRYTNPHQWTRTADYKDGTDNRRGFTRIVRINTNFYTPNSPQPEPSSCKLVKLVYALEEESWLPMVRSGLPNPKAIQ